MVRSASVAAVCLDWTKLEPGRKSQAWMLVV